MPRCASRRASTTQAARGDGTPGAAASGRSLPPSSGTGEGRLATCPVLAVGWAASALPPDVVEPHPRQRTEERTTHRNGSRSRLLSIKAGDVELRIPKSRAGPFLPSLLEPRRRIDRALWAVVMEAYVHGSPRWGSRPGSARARSAGSAPSSTPSWRPSELRLFGIGADGKFSHVPRSGAFGRHDDGFPPTPRSSAHGRTSPSVTLAGVARLSAGRVPIDILVASAAAAAAACTSRSGTPVVAASSRTDSNSGIAPIT